MNSVDGWGTEKKKCLMDNDVGVKTGTINKKKSFTTNNIPTVLQRSLTSVMTASRPP